MLHHRAILVSAASLMLVAAGRAQTYGTVSLDPSLADASAQVTGVHNKDGGSPLGFCEGPSSDAEGNVYFTEANPSRIWKVTPAGQASVFGGSTSYSSNGTEVDPQGRIIVCQKSAVAAYTPGGIRTVLQSAANEINLNDLTISSTGAMYYSHWGANVFFRSAEGQVTTLPGFQTANGVEWIEERKKLYVAQDGPDEVWVYDVGADGKLSNGKVFKAVQEPDGITADEKGNIYVASWMEGKVLVFDTTGKSLGSITVTGAPGSSSTSNGQNGNTSNVVFGGPDRKTLYITGDGGLYKVPMKVAGRTRPGTVNLKQENFVSKKSGIRISHPIFNPGLHNLVIDVPITSGRARVRVVDARMRELWAAPAKKSAVTWNGVGANGKPLPSGRYFILAESGSRNVTAASVFIAKE